MSDSIFAPGFKETPFWWEAAPRPSMARAALPATGDVVIVGSGYTGLTAGLALARNGRQVQVIEAKDPGYGASSRNAGACGRTFRFSFGELLQRYGVERALEVYRQLYKAHDFAVGFIGAEGIECHLNACGRYIAAVSPRHFDGMVKDVELRRKHLPIKDVLVPAEEQERMIRFGKYHGGRMVPDWHGLHPALYHQGLLRRALDAGVQIFPQTTVTGIRPGSGQTVVSTSQGDIAARDVVVATNGYTGPATPYFRRRLVPFPAYMAATEPIGREAVRALIPGGQIFSDSLENMFYIRESPDGERLLFGGLTGSSPRSLRAMAAALHKELVKLIPGMAQVRLSHVWTGKCSAGFSMFPHIGRQDGVHYAIGYAFAGVAMGTYFGNVLARRILGQPDSATAFDSIPLQTRPYHRGRTWFLPLAAAYINFKDRMSI